MARAEGSFAGPETSTFSAAPSTPAISLPRGGGAIRSIGESFSANAANGTGSFKIPIAVSPSRAGFQPQLELAYDSGAGNGPFGFGWSMRVPAIVRRTDRGIPEYRDAEESDTFQMAGVEDLVPELAQAGDGSWKRLVLPQRTVGGVAYSIQRYRPRMEGLFERIERWTNLEDPTDVFWRTISKANITSWYGKTSSSRIADPADRSRIFSWLLCESYDDKGHVVAYGDKEEDGARIFEDDAGQPVNKAHEANRAVPERCAQRYLKRIRYGNRAPFYPVLKPGSAWPEPPGARTADGSEDWHFEVVLDYGEHDDDQPLPGDAGIWPCRPDPFSVFRQGFEVRTYRLCRRVLMFHHFEDEPGVEKNCLVRSTDLEFLDPAHAAVSPVYTFLRSVGMSGYRRSPAGYDARAFPPIAFTYSEPIVNEDVEEIDAASLENIPAGLQEGFYRWVDLHGEGVPGILTEQAGAWFYKRNLSPLSPPGEGGAKAVFAPAELVPAKPSFALAAAEFADLSGDGQLDLVLLRDPVPGFFEHDKAEGWQSFRPFTGRPAIDFSDPNLRFVDLDGDGRADLLISEDEALVWHRSLGEDGYGPACRVTKALSEELGPRIIFADGTQSVYLADLSGDGLLDIVRIRNGEVCYWPSFGHGRFGAKVVMDRAPLFDRPDQFDVGRVRLADIDGSGTSDIIYLHPGGVRLYFNQSGNGWSEAQTLKAFPAIDSLASIVATDLLGNGTTCLVWSSPLEGSARRCMRYVNLMGSTKPHLLAKSVNNLGAETEVRYASSTRFYLEDRAAGQPWRSKLPFPVFVVERVISRDLVNGSSFASTYSYHHGCFDADEREFRGFGMVEQVDTQSFEAYVGAVDPDAGAQAIEAEAYQPPVRTRTWFHTGSELGQADLIDPYRSDYFGEVGIPPSVLPEGLTGEEFFECVRGLKGLQLRQEIYSDDGSDEAGNPYAVTEKSYELRLLQPRGPNRHAVVLPIGRETIGVNYERSLDDPRISHSFALDLDEYGNARLAASVAYGRRQADMALPAEVRRDQAKTSISFAETDYTPALDDAASPDLFRLPVPFESRDFELTGIASAGLFTFKELADAVALASPIDFEDVADNAGIERRLIGRSITTFLDNDLAELPRGEWDTLAIANRNYQLAFTPSLTQVAFNGQIGDADLEAAGYVHFEGDSNWWVPSSAPIYPADPSAVFFAPSGTQNPFGIETVATLDDYALLITKVEVVQAPWNVVSATNDYRILGPVFMTDLNGNRSAIEHDELGLITKSATMGKEGLGEGDTLADPTTRVEYVLSNWMENRQPNFAHSFAREQHGAGNPRWQESFAYFNGSGGVALVKAQAPPGKALAIDAGGALVEVDADPRWVGSGRVVLNNKGNMVKRYEPYFSATSEYENARAIRELGVTPFIHYDALGRNLRTDFPNGTFTRADYGPWSSSVYDSNDTVRQSRWFTERGSPDPTAEAEPSNDDERRAAWLAAKHDDTPGTTYFDALSRRIYAVTDFGGGKRAAVRSEMDLTGRTSRMLDALGREVSAGFVAMAGIACWGESAEKGRKWLFQDVLGSMVKSWDDHGRSFRAVYDKLHRSSGTMVKEQGGAESLYTYIVYGDRLPGAADLNLIGVTYLVLDQVGQLRIAAADFNGNPLRTERRLAKDYKDLIDWTAVAGAASVAALEAAADPLLEDEVFVSSADYDALDRPTRIGMPDGSALVPTYDEAGLLAKLKAESPGGGAAVDVIAGQAFDAQGRRTALTLGNGLISRFTYDPESLRLSRLVTAANSAGANPIQDLNYSYDPVGNIVGIRDDAQQTHFFNNAAVRPQNLFEYDPSYQLIRARGRELAGLANDAIRTAADLAPNNLPDAQNPAAVRLYTEDYEYDLAGNIVSLKHRFAPQPLVGDGWTRKYRYQYQNSPGDRTNRLAATSAPGDPDAGPFTDSYDHDDYGNITRMPHLASMRWDELDQLREVDLGGGGKSYYVYDSEGERIRKVIERPGGAIIERIYLGCVEIYRERTGAAAVTLERKTLKVNDSDSLVAQVDMKTVDTAGSDPANPLGTPLIRYQHGNHLGSALVETNEAGAVISYEEYHPFGTTAYRSQKAGVGLSLKRTRFAGKELDDETGLYQMGARYYAPWLGRWTSSDPAGLADGANLYRYCRNSPILLQDPSGLQVEIPGTRADHLTENSTFEERQAFALRHGRRMIDPNPAGQRWVGNHWELSPEGHLERIEEGEGEEAGDAPISSESAEQTTVDVSIEPAATPDANAGTTGATGGSESSAGSGSNSQGGNPGGQGSGAGSGSGEGSGGGGERSWFTSSFFRGLVVGLVVTVAVVAIVATGGAALAVIAPGASAAIGASGIGTVLAVGGTALTVANTVQSVRQRDLWNNPISEDEANYNLGLGIGGAMGGAVAKPVAQLGTGLGTALGRGGGQMAAGMADALEGGTFAFAGGGTATAEAVAPVANGVSTTTAVTLGAVGTGSTTALMRHTADWEHRGPDGRIETRGRVSSGRDKPPGRRLNFNEQLQTHTERKIIKMLRGRVQPGDHVTIRGTRPPCNPGGRGCGTAMQTFAQQMQIRITYTNTTTGQVYRYP